MIRTGLMISTLVVLAMVGLSAWAWMVTPADTQIAVHWSATGEVNRYGTRLEAFGLIPAMTAGLSLLMALAPRIDPRGRNLEKSGPLLITVWLGLLAILAMTHLALILPAVGLVEADSEFTPKFVLIAVCVFMAVIGNVLGKARPNWFVGVRTPWSLSSDRSWDITHRWAGRGFVLTGLVGGAAMVFAPISVGLTVFLTLMGITAVGSLAVSYFAWRSDPDRETFNEAD